LIYGEKLESATFSQNKVERRTKDSSSVLLFRHISLAYITHLCTATYY